MKKFHKHIFFLILFFQYFVSNSQNTVYQIDITKGIREIFLKNEREESEFLF